MTPITPTMPESTAVSEKKQPSRQTSFLILAAAWMTGMAIVVPAEWLRLREVSASPAGWAGWFFDWNVDTTPYFLLLTFAPVLWYVTERYRSPSVPPPVAESTTCSLDERAGKPCLGAACVGMLSLIVSWWVAWQPMGGEPPLRFGELPPAYHDEYSYLFQAQTFLAGRTWFPSHPAFPELFDQVHVLNEGKFASRYFPGTGAWIAPFLAMGRPYWGHWIAGGLTAGFVFLAGWELSGRNAAWWAGLLTAFSPGLALFSNLLLSHHPTLVGLFFFLWQYLRMLRTGSATHAVLAGCGLSFAMLCRPMTAAGFGLPFGCWFVWWMIRGSRWKFLPAMGLPLLAGVIVMTAYNHSITGTWTESPYQLYTDIYTPRHVYGFNNVVRGEHHLGPKVLEHYDKWAENLDWKLARKNVFQRLLASGQWIWGLVPLALSLVVVLGYEIFAAKEEGRCPHIWLIVAAILSLHAAHIPYWYDGIMHWHYVFETAPLWLLLSAVASTRVAAMSVQRLGVRWIDACWKGMFVAAFLVNFIPLAPFWSASKIGLGVNNIGFSRLNYEACREVVQQGVTERPAVVLVVPDAADRHIDFVTNSPPLDGEVLFARWKPGLSDKRQELERAFPGRIFYILDAARLQLRRF